MSILSGRLNFGSAKTRFLGKAHSSILMNWDGCGEMMRGRTNASSDVENPLMSECSSTLMRCCALVLVVPIPFILTDDGCNEIPIRLAIRSVTKLT